MNQYPAWKNLLIVFILLAGTLYALPNLFGEDPALQVTSARGFALPPPLLRLCSIARGCLPGTRRSLV